MFENFLNSNFSALSLPPGDHEKYEKTFNDTIEDAKFYREQIKAKKSLDLSCKIEFFLPIQVAPTEG